MPFDPSTAEAVPADLINDDKVGVKFDMTVNPDGTVNKKTFDPSSAVPVSSKPKSVSKIAAAVSPNAEFNADQEAQMTGGDALAPIVTGAIATPLAGLAGIGAGYAKTMVGPAVKSIFGVDMPDAADVVRGVQNALTYQPRTEVGQKASDAINAIPEKIADWGDQAGKFTTDKTGSPALGAAVNTAIQASPMILAKTAGRIAPKAATPLDKVATEGTTAEKLNAPTRSGIEEANANGYSVTPNMAQAGPVATNLEGLAGSAKLQKSMSNKNQPVTNAFIREDVGLPSDEPLSIKALDNLQKEAGQAYEQAKGMGKIAVDDQYEPNHLSPKIETVDNGSKWLNSVEQHFIEAGDAIDKLKELRADARDYYNSYKRNPHPDTLKEAKASTQAAEQLESLIERNLENSGQSPELLSNLREARTQIAKISQAKKALNDSTGNIDAGDYAKMLEKNPGLLTGPALKVAKFAQQFPKAAVPAEKIGHFGMDAADILLSLMNHSKAAATGAMSLGLRPGARALLGTRTAQNMMTAPATGAIGDAVNSAFPLTLGTPRNDNLINIGGQ